MPSWENPQINGSLPKSEMAPNSNSVAQGNLLSRAHAIFPSGRLEWYYNIYDKKVGPLTYSGGAEANWH